MKCFQSICPAPARLMLALCALTLFIPAISAAQPNKHRGARAGALMEGDFFRGGDALGERRVMRQLRDVLFPPRMVLRFREALELDRAQLDQLRGLIKASQSERVDLRFELDEAAIALKGLLKANPIDEQAALAAAARVMGHERALKENQLRLMIRVKNLLRAPQRALLEEKQAARRARRAQRKQRRARQRERRHDRRERRRARRSQGGEGEESGSARD